MSVQYERHIKEKYIRYESAYMRRISKFFPAVILAFGGLLSSGVTMAEQEVPTTLSPEFQAKLQTMLREVNSDAAKREAVMSAGRDRAIFCSYCHGMDGNSEQPDYPNLAGQNPLYLLEQIEKFADGRRKKPVMNALSEIFTTDEKMLLAVYYAISPLKPANADPAIAQLGESLYQNRCMACHGPDGRGEKGFARLAGQKPDYVKKVLKGFRMGTDKRQNPLMQAVASTLSDTQIEAVAAYVANLR
ncbi:MAG: c-type cytochrome [Gammaproteobacteria bacterium]